MRVKIFALNDGKLDAAYLRSVARRRNDWATRLAEGPCAPRNPWLDAVQAMWEGWEPQAGIELAQAIQEAVAGYLMSRGRQGDFGFQMEDRVTFVSSAPGNLIPVQPVKHTVPVGRAVRPAEPRAAQSPRFEIPDALVA